MTIVNINATNNADPREPTNTFAVAPLVIMLGINIVRKKSINNISLALNGVLLLLSLILLFL